MIRRAIERDARCREPPQCVPQLRPRRILDRHVIQPRRARRRCPPAGTLPGFQPEVMMIPAGRKKRCLSPDPLRHLKPEHIPIERQRPLQIRHLQMPMADADCGVNGCGAHS